MRDIKPMEEKGLGGGSSPSLDGGERVHELSQEAIYHDKDVFGDEENHEIKYKVSLRLS